MTGTYVIIGLALVLAIVAILLGRSSRSAGTDSRDLSGIFLDGIPAKHPRLFPIIQQALSNQDAEFLNSHVEPRSRKRALAARRAAALFFLAGLRADFRKLTELSRLLAKAAPEYRTRDRNGADQARMEIQLVVCGGVAEVAHRCIAGCTAPRAIGYDRRNGIAVGSCDACVAGCVLTFQSLMGLDSVSALLPPAELGAMCAARRSRKLPLQRAFE